MLVVRAGPPARREALFRVAGMWERAPTSEERWWIHRLGGDMFLATLVLEDGTSVDVAARRSVRPALLDGVPLENAA